MLKSFAFFREEQSSAIKLIGKLPTLLYERSFREVWKVGFFK
jgi:hypothetical protein